jgi:hypothetical protein
MAGLIPLEFLLKHDMRSRTDAHEQQRPAYLANGTD